MFEKGFKWVHVLNFLISILQKILRNFIYSTVSLKLYVAMSVLFTSVIHCVCSRLSLQSFYCLAAPTLLQQSNDVEVTKKNRLIKFTSICLCVCDVFQVHLNKWDEVYSSRLVTGACKVMQMDVLFEFILMIYGLKESENAMFTLVIQYLIKFNCEVFKP